MSEIKSLASEFLAQDHFAVIGISRQGGDPGTLIRQKLKGAGKSIYMVNPRTDRIDGEHCYPSVAQIPIPVDVAIITTHPDATPTVLRECRDAGISRAWVHRSFGGGSMSPDAVDYCKANNISLIAGGCPMMYCEPVDFGHKCMRWVLSAVGKLP